MDTRGGQRTREGDSEHARPARARHFLLTHRPARSPSYLSARSRHCLPTGLLARETADTRVRQARVTAYPPACSLGRQRTREGDRHASLLTHRPARSGDRHASLLTHRPARSGDRHASRPARSIAQGRYQLYTHRPARSPSYLSARPPHPPTGQLCSFKAGISSGRRRETACSLAFPPAC